MELEKMRIFPTMGLYSLSFAPSSSVEALNAGLFISPGYGRHPVRAISSNELIFVKSGVLGIFEGDDNFEVASGQTLLLSEGIQHGGTLDYSSELQFYWLHFKSHPAVEGQEALAIPKLATLRRPERMVELLRIFLDDQESGSLSRPRADALLELMLLETLEGLGSAANHLGVSDERLVTNAENIMKSKFTDPDFSSSSLAGALKCNPDYLNRVYRRLRGCTITGALQRLRVNLTAQLLLDGRSNVEEAALMGGFSDRTYMRRVFKKLKGMTPKDYRNLHLRMHINTR